MVQQIAVTMVTHTLFSKGFLTLLFLISLISFNASAVHESGAHITWKCIGKDSFKVELTVYRDCNSIAFSAPTIDVNSNCGNQRLQLKINSSKDITSVCQAQCTPCSTGRCNLGYGMQEIKSSATIDVSTYRNNNCCELTFSYSTCCRVNLGRTNLYVESKMDICQSPCDNSPIILAPELSVLCLNQNVMYSHQALDPDGDSLHYELVNAMGSATYPKDYSGTKPLYFLGFPKKNNPFPQGFHLDGETGLLKFRPKKEEVATIVVKIESYRKGKLISSVMKDMMVTVMKCRDNYSPVLSGIDCSDPTAKNLEMEVCAGQEVCFDICISDPDKRDSLYVDWNQGIPGASFTINRGVRETGTFCWTPEEKHIRSLPYRFTVFGEDWACPIVGSTHQTYTLWVKHLPPAIAISDTADSCGHLKLMAERTGRSPISSYNWKVDNKEILHSGTYNRDTLEYQTPVSGNFKYRLEVTDTNGCKKTFSDSIHVADHIGVDVNDTVACTGDSLQLTAKALNPQGNYFIFWESSDTTFNGPAPYKTLASGNDTTVLITANDGICEFKKEVLIQSNAYPSFTLDDSMAICEGHSVLLSPVIQLAANDPGSVLKYQWYGPGIIQEVSTNKTIAASSLGNYRIEVTDSLGCTSIDSIQIFKDRSWIPQNLEICKDDSIVVMLPSGSIPTDYYWSDPGDTNPVSFTGANRILKPDSTGYYYIKRVNLFQGAPCSTSDSFLLTINPVPGIQIQPKNSSICPDELLTLSGSPAGGKWTGPNISSSSTSITFTSDSVAGVYSYTYQFTDSNLCSSADSSLVTVLNQPKASFSVSKSSINLGQNGKFISTSTNAQNSSVQWFLQDTVSGPYYYNATGDTVTIQFNDPGRYDLQLIVTDTLTNCSDTITQSGVIGVYVSLPEIEQHLVKVYPNPTQNQIWIEWKDATQQGDFILWNTAGEQVYRQELSHSKESISLENLPAGIYYWNAKTQQKTSVGKLIVLKR